ncbi:unnamed protein product [Allacma fusca]|uniref:Inosine/uridine-preferring nucleoside hydrolase domain-containing protein n=1 Tax=Allacma fusca TaxID=39272 RepID=A0A8J2PNX1_9HEXA|nr:unnamed protein product [Allacma fusca]
MDDKIVIIDTDAGTDDATAIFIALAAHKDPNVNFRIAGITCVNGNTTVDNVCTNVTRILQTADALEIPIFRGCENAMSIPYVLGEHCVPYHGYDGFGDVDLPKIEPKLEDENGVLAIIKLAKEYPGQVSILALGPLTNLAMAVRLEPGLRKTLREIVVMGGNTEAVGNTTVCGEFNFRVDPEAAHVTLATFECPIVVVPWEINKRQNHKDFRLSELTKIKSPAMDLMNRIEVHNVKKVRWSPCDALAAAVLVEPKVIQDSKVVHTTVELFGHHTRGQMVIDHENLLNQRKNAEIVHGIDIPLYLDIIRWGFGGPSYTLKNNENGE